MLQTHPPRRSSSNIFLKVASGSSAALVAISGVALMIMVLLVSYDVILRNTAGTAMTGVAEATSEWLMPATVLFALAFAEYKNEHIRVTIVEDFLRGNPQMTLRLLGQLITVAIAVLLTWSSYHLAVDAFEIRETVPMGTELLAVWPIKMAVFLGWVGLLVQTVANLIAIIVPQREVHPHTDEGSSNEYGNEAGSGA